MSTLTGSVALAEEEFVLLTTYRRSGAAVSVPVWIAPSSDADRALLITTTARSGKVRRLRRDPRVELRPCGRRGEVTPGAPVLRARAELVEDADEVRRLREMIRRKYGERMKLTAADRGLEDPAEPARVIVRINADGRDPSGQT